MSKRYKEEINKIVMNDDMKRRILQNVLASNENGGEKNIKVEITASKVKKHTNFKRNMQTVAAGFTIVLCLSIAKNYPILLKNTTNDLPQEETAKSHDEGNNDFKTSDNKNVDYNNDSKEVSNNNPKEGQALNQNNNDDGYVKEDHSASSKIVQEANSKDKLQSNSGSEIAKSQTSQNNDNKVVTNSNISSKTSTEEDINNKANKTITAADSQTAHGDILESKLTGNDPNSNVSDTSIMAEQAVNYSQEYKSLAEAEKALNLKVNSLKILPKGFKMGNISIIANEIIQVDYNDSKSNITFRAGKDIDNISDDYNVYQVKKTVKVNGLNVNLEGNRNEEYNLAVWEKDGISYSISAENGIDQKSILDMIL